MEGRLMTLKQVLARITLSKTEVYRRIAAGTFPKPVRLGPRRIAFVEDEINEWIVEQVNSRGLSAL